MKFKINFRNPCFFPAILVFVYTVIYLPSITRLGFYWDDWQVVFLNLMHTPADYWNYFLADRPFSIWTYLITIPILGMSPLPWQIFTLVMRITAAWFFAATLSTVWKDRVWESRLAAVLLLVFPGFTQTTISVAYSQHFITQALFFASLWLMLKSIDRPKISLWMVSLSCLFSLTQMLTMEYFAAQELIRPVLIFFFLQNTQGIPWKAALRTVSLYWLPYFIPLGLFALWRFGYYPTLSAENTPTLLAALLTAPIATLKQLVQFALQDTVFTSFTVWMSAFNPVALDDQSLIPLILSLVSAIMIGFWFWKTGISKRISDLPPDKFIPQAVIAAILFLLLGGLPVWSTNRQVLLGLWSDRFTLAPMAGSALLLTTITTWLSRDRTRQIVILAVLMGMAVFSQLLTVAKYTDNWQIQRDFYWQLKWRAPDLKPNTALVAPKLPTSYISDYAVGFGLNAMYAREPVDKKAQYWFFTGPRAEGDYFARYQPGLPIQYSLRDVTFSGNTNETLGISFSAGRDCLRVLDPFYYSAPPRLSDNLGGIEKDIQPISNMDRILPVPATDKLRSDVFGSEPEHTWCYYFQKADLSRQFEDWKEIPLLAQQAEENGFRSKVGAEYLPFIEGYAQTSMWDKALDTSLISNSLTVNMEPALCSMWNRYSGMGNDAKLKSAADEFYNRVDCSKVP